MRSAAGLPELSQRGDGGLLRNVRLGGKLLPKMLRKVPEKGTLELDYCSTLLDGKLRTDPHVLRPVEGEPWRMFRAEFVKALTERKLATAVARIRSAARGMHFAAAQVLEMHEVCGRPEMLVDLICVLWGRTIDVHVLLDDFLVKLGAKPRLDLFARQVCSERPWLPFCSTLSFLSGHDGPLNDTQPQHIWCMIYMVSV